MQVADATGRSPSHKPMGWLKGFLHRAASWMKARRVVTMVEFHIGELFPRVGFIVTRVKCTLSVGQEVKTESPGYADASASSRSTGVDSIRSVGHPPWLPQPGKAGCMQSKREPSYMTGQIEKIAANHVPEAELRIVEVTASSGTIVRLQGVSVATAPRTGEKIELKEGTFKVVEVSHEFSGSPLKHVVVVAVEKPQPTVAE